MLPDMADVLEKFSSLLEKNVCIHQTLTILDLAFETVLKCSDFVSCSSTAYAVIVVCHTCGLCQNGLQIVRFFCYFLVLIFQFCRTSLIVTSYCLQVRPGPLVKNLWR